MLFKFAKDRKRWLHWLYEAKKRYGLVILHYVVTSNHIHLIAAGGKERDAIPDSITLIAGRIAQECNQRKNRNGAFWVDLARPGLLPDHWKFPIMRVAGIRK
ncbi:MAG: transposase [Deltaproteobacteria bacterium]|nr:transposase [Deltaproteobacteria bacterium]